MPTPRRAAPITVILFAICAATLLAQWAASSAEAKPAAAKVERGRHLVETIGCSDCHTPMRFDEKAGMPVPDRSRFLSGHPAGAPVPASLAEGTGLAIGVTATSFRLPFGVVYAANLTPDASGLEAWSEEMFVKALRTGRHMGGNGRPIYPPMPWPAFRNLGDDDLKAIYAYLRTVPPVRNDVPDVEVAPPAEAAIVRMNDAIAKH
jgi:mono/diheme cytochrome c family protein